MQDLPLITRDPYSLVLLSPGTMQSNTYLGGFSVNGARERDNNFMLDGADNNDTSVPGIAGGLTSLNPDSTEEFRIITNNFQPEFGRNDGAIVDIVTKSGTNDFHGNARWFGRYNGFGGARDYFNPAVNPDGSTNRMNPYVRNQFGFSVGGPIVKNKTFFFVDNEFQRFHTTLTDASTVPTAAFTTGTFNYTDVNGNTWPIDLTSTASGNNAEGLPLDAFITSEILSLYPANPNGPAVDSVRSLDYFPSTSKFSAWNLTAKLDHHINDREALNLRAAYDRGSDPNACPLCAILPSLDGYNTKYAVSNIALGLTSTLKTNLVNDAKFGVNRLDDGFFCNGLSTFNSIGPLDQYGRARDYALPGLSGFGCGTLGDSDGQYRRTGTWSWGDSLSWVRGSHTIKFGAEFRRIFEDGYNSFGSRDVATFQGFTDFGIPWVNLDPSNPCNPGDPDYSTNGCGSPDLQGMGELLFGFMDTESQNQFFSGKALAQTSTDNRKFRYHEYGFYGQDSWKVRSNLTLNFGLRYEFNGVPFETSNTFSNLYQDPSGFAPFTFQAVGPGTGRLLYSNDYHDFEPRVGFSWDPFKNGKTSLRAGFGIFHDRIFGNLLGNARGNPPFQQTYFNEPIFTASPTPDTEPMPPTMPATAVVDQDAFITPDIIAANIKMPYEEAWNFGVQHELGRNLTVEVDYVGRRGGRLWRAVNGNQPQTNLIQELLANGDCFGVPCSQYPQFVSGQLLYLGGVYGIYTLNGSRFDTVNNTAFFEAVMNQSSAHSFYHAAQANVTKRMSHGMQLQGAYTWAHSIDDSADPLAPGEGAFGHSFPRNSFKLALERGNSDFDVRQRLSINYVWELPFGRGKAYASSGVLGKVLEGWQISGITVFQTGLHFSVFGYRDSQRTGLSDRADIVGSLSLPPGHPKNMTGPPLSAFDVPPFDTAGNSGRNRFSGPGTNNWNAVVAKNTKITERVNLQFRAEAFNLFNRTAFDMPDGQMVDAGTFGLSTLTLTQPDGTTSARQMQFALKLQF
jgi:outer membrane receptor protein involved in Fe transport